MSANGDRAKQFWVGINGTRKDVFEAYLPSAEDMARYAYLHGPFNDRAEAQRVADRTHVIAESFTKKD